MRLSQKVLRTRPQKRTFAATSVCSPHPYSRDRRFPISTSAFLIIPCIDDEEIDEGHSYKANNMSVVSTVVDEKTGEERTRLIDKQRWKGYGPATVSFSDAKVREWKENYAVCISWLLRMRPKTIILDMMSYDSSW